MQQLERRRETNKLEAYSPYPWQEKFHNAEGHKTTAPAVEKAAITANQVGKTTSAAMEVAMHLTGQYPDWYKGIRFRVPVDWIVAGNTNEVTRDICQNELFGDPKDDKKFGTGAVPLHLIGKKERKPGVPNALETVQVKHVPSGRWSAVTFKCYEQGPKKFMGLRSNGGWLDEEPPEEILSQVRRSVFAKNPSLILLTFTPEEGVTKVVHQFMDYPQKGQAVITATWDDAPHMTVEMREQKLATISSEEEKELRSKGAPFAGAGLIFPVSDEKIIVDPFEIPPHFTKINGIDFGWDHPFAAANIAHDRDADCVYLTAEYFESKATPPIHCAAIKPWGEWIPVVWPADGLQTEKGSGKALMLQYRTQGLYMLPDHFTNPPRPGEEEGTGGYGVEPGLIEMLTRMQTGRFKVFRNCQKFITEKRSYHRDKNGLVVKINDDVISATRYAVMSLRHARIRPLRRAKSMVPTGMSNW